MARTSPYEDRFVSQAQLTDMNDYAQSRSPLDGAVLARYPYADDVTVEATLAQAEQGWRNWRDTSLTQRQQVLRQFAVVLRQQMPALARLATLEMGKPLAQAIGEVEKCALLCEWYAEHGPALLADQTTPVGPDAYISFLPIGPILGVMPWNFPYWQALRGAVPILLGGNGYVLKHAPNVMGCAYLLAQCAEQAGFPPGTFSVLNVTPSGVSRAIADRRIAGVAVTGSVRAGAAIAAQAGAALKKTVLELGGNDPFIVLADADLDAAVKAAVIGRFQNTGQVCIAAKRIILEQPIAQAFTERFLEATRKLVVGDPLQTDTYIGPMARYDLRDELHQQVQASLAAGAQLLLGGDKIAGLGNYYAPTIIADVAPGMPAFDEELFGPVASLMVARDATHAIELANHSEFGLSGALWTRDRARAAALARQLETGGLFVNSFSASDPRVPIGGVKKSGYGRELSYFGVHEFMNAQTVWFNRT